MNLQRECIRCGDFFPVKPMELKFFCDKENCQQNSYNFYSPESMLNHIKQNRAISMDHFDIYDLDRPIYYDNKEIKEYQRVCRICGKPLLNAKGNYSYYKRYCNEHNGDELWAKYNWNIRSKSYAYYVQEQQKEEIESQLKNIPEKLHNLVILCEICGKQCLTRHYYCCLTDKEKMDVINIHHKVPVHTLDWDNLYLLWDYENLIALCNECHNAQDHQLKKINQIESNKIEFQKITDFI